VGLTPHPWVGNVAECREVDAPNEMTSGSREDDHRIGAILPDAVEGVDEVRVVTCGERHQRPAFRVELHNEYAASVPIHLQAAIRREIVRLNRRHSHLLCLLSILRNRITTATF